MSVSGDEPTSPPEDHDDATEEREQTRTEAVWEQVWTLALAILIALGIRAFVIEPFRIPSGSMLPTLLIGDHLFVNKFIYGPRIPFTEIRLPGLREPERGDIIVFEVARGVGGRQAGIYPADERPELPRDDFVKRLVGLPGDELSVVNGRVFVNGEEMSWAETGDSFVDAHGRTLSWYRESLGACLHDVLDDPVPGVGGAPPRTLTVPEGRYFMMGDNRDWSNDSRGWGTVRLEEMKGPAFFLYWSWDVNGSAVQFLNPWNWLTAEKRWDRTFSRVACDDASAGEGAALGRAPSPEGTALAVDRPRAPGPG